MHCRVILEAPLSGFQNMARDEALLLSQVKGAEPVFRLYRWQPPALSLGYFQSWKSVADLDNCKKLGVDLVRRPTGGRAILHDRELTYSVIMPSGAEKLLDSFKRINQALLTGLLLLGADARLIPRIPSPATGPKNKTAACFASPSSYELKVNGKKLLGSAQLRKNGILLQHGSLPLKLNREKLYDCLYFPQAESRQAGLSQAYSVMISLEEALQREVSWEETARAVIAGFENAWQIKCRQGCFSKQEEKKAAILLETKYSRAEWNFRR